MATRILGLLAALLAALLIHQYRETGQLRRDLSDARAQAAEQARASTIAALGEEAGDVQRALAWLNDFYKAPDGLQRSDGLWIGGHPDFEGIGAWIFGVYVPHRLRGDSDETSRQAIVEAIRRSDEWQSKHRGRS
jgi:hypothetical protein